MFSDYLWSRHASSIYRFESISWQIASTPFHLGGMNPRTITMDCPNSPHSNEQQNIKKEKSERGLLWFAKKI